MSHKRFAITECVACKGSASKIGEVPYAFHFLQHRISEPLDTGDLYECSVCGLWFKYPYLSQDQVAKFYMESPDTLSWDGEDARSDFNTAISEIVKALPEGGSVLDFGCYKGGFLRLLPKRYTRHGIEPSLAGAEAATNFDIEVIGQDAAALGDRQFDCITMFDVFEHLVAPLSTVDTLFDHIRPGGLLCVATGFADYSAFRRWSAKYSYVCMPEHSCFLTGKFLSFLHNRYHTTYQTFPISRTHRNLRIAAINCINLSMVLLKSKRAIFYFYLTGWLRRISSKGMQPFSADHVVVVLRKPPSFPA